MSSKPVAFLRAGLGVTKTHSRPYVWTSPIVSTPSASQTSEGTASGSLADENGLALFEDERGLIVVDHWTIDEVSKPSPEWRCSSLYQWKNPCEKARLS
jgi:hypothetical protein